MFIHRQLTGVWVASVPALAGTAYHTAYHTRWTTYTCISSSTAQLQLHIQTHTFIWWLSCLGIVVLQKFIMFLPWLNWCESTSASVITVHLMHVSCEWIYIRCHVRALVSGDKWMHSSQVSLTTLINLVHTFVVSLKLLCKCTYCRCHVSALTIGVMWVCTYCRCHVSALTIGVMWVCTYCRCHVSALTIGVMWVCTYCRCHVSALTPGVMWVHLLQVSCECTYSKCHVNALTPDVMWVHRCAMSALTSGVMREMVGMS